MLAWGGSPVAGAADPPTPPAPPVLYTVQRGDTLSTIARDQLGDINKWQALYRLERPQIGNNPDLLYVGELLTFAPGTPRQRNVIAVPPPLPSHSGAVPIDAEAAARVKHQFGM